MKSGRHQPVVVQSIDGRTSAKFVWQHDRYVHQIFVDQILVAESIDGNSDAEWPPSPPIQQLSLEQIDGRPVVLGVGGAGRSHWSLSAGSAPDRSDSLRFELACRCHHHAPQLVGSSYRVTGPVELICCQSEQRRRGDQIEFRPIAGDGPTWTWSYLAAIPVPRPKK